MNDGGVAAMNKLAAFRQEASVGARVTLRLTRGEDVSGRVAQLDDAYVRLDLEGRTVTIFAEILAGWELHHGAGAEPVTVGRREALRSPAKLYPDDDFRHLDNRYAPFAEGGGRLTSRTCLSAAASSWIGLNTHFSPDRQASRSSCSARSAPENHP